MVSKVSTMIIHEEENKSVSQLQIFLLIFIPFSCGYFLTSFFNQINAMLAPYISSEIKLSATELGLTTSIYLLSFAFAQLPLGVLLDRFGARRIQTILFFIAALGICLFASAHQAGTLLVGRALIGVGMSGGLMAAFKAIAIWLPRERIPSANGSLMALGTVGALVSTSPVEWMLGHINWRELFVLFALITLATALLIYYFVPEKKYQQQHLSIKSQWQDIKMIYRNKLFWQLAPLSALAFGSNMAIVGLWAGGWLNDVAGFSSLVTSKHLLAISIALIIGIIVNGFIADFATQVLKQPIARVIGIGLFFYIIVQSILILGNNPGSYLLWVMFGFCSRSTTLTYAAMSQNFPIQYAGRATTAINLLFFLVAFFTQFIIGAIVDLWPALPAGGYPAIAYRTAFGAILILQILGYLWFLWSRHSMEDK